MTDKGLSAVLDMQDAGEDDLQELGLLALPQEELEAVVRAAGGGLCVMCSHGGVRTVTRERRDVPHDFLGTLWRGAQTECLCGCGLVSLPVCLDCQEYGLDSPSHDDEACPVCGADGRAADIRPDLGAVEEAGAEEAETYLRELTDENSMPREATLEDLQGLAWDEGVLNATTRRERLDMAGIDVAGLSDRATARLWELVQRAWCEAYNRGGNAVIKAAREELEAAADETGA